MTNELSDPDGSASFLALDAKINQRTVLDRLIATEAGAKPSSPIVVELDMTSFCDFGCPECISSDVLGVSRFTRSRLLDLCEEFASSGVKAVILTGGGEPLRHHSAPMVMESLTRMGISVGLITSGLLLATISPALIRSLSWVRISLDAASFATYDIFRPHPLGAKALEMVLDGIRHAVQSGAPRVGISYVLLSRGDQDNIDELGQAAQLALDLGVDYLNVKAMQNSDHTLYRYTDKQRTRINESLELARSLETDQFRVIASANVGAVLNGKFEQPKQYSRCLSISLRTLITPDGMYPCAYHRGNQRLQFSGDPRADAFGALWSSAAVGSVNPSIDCRFHCARHEANLTLESLSKSTPVGADAPPIEDWDLFI